MDFDPKKFAENVMEQLHQQNNPSPEELKREPIRKIYIPLSPDSKKTLDSPSSSSASPEKKEQPVS
jgi:hypothetical protein